MKMRNIVPIVGLMVLSFAACTVNTAQQPAKTSDEAFRINVPIISSPSSAEISIDGDFVGTTNSSFQLTPGEHRIEISREGFEPWSRTVTVVPGTQIRVDLVRR